MPRTALAHPAPARLAAVLALAALAVAACGLLAGCGGSAGTESREPAYVSPYDWDALARDGAGRLTYSEGGAVASLAGIDVSEHQGAIDWEAVAADGIDFAMVRIGNRGATEGALYLDERAADNLAGARAAGIAVGAYFFSQAVSDDEAREEAAFVLEHLDGAPLDFPIAFDQEPVHGMEGRANALSREQLTRNARIFCEAMEAAGYTPMVYGNKQDVAKLDRSALADWEFWFAEYGAARPSAQFDFRMWQYANDGEVAGIATRVDLNLWLPIPPR